MQIHQVLEGPRAAVLGVYDQIMISNDMRHCQVSVRNSKNLKGREYESWMGLIHLIEVILLHFNVARMYRWPYITSGRLYLMRSMTVVESTSGLVLISEWWYLCCVLIAFLGMGSI